MADWLHEIEEKNRPERERRAALEAEKNAKLHRDVEERKRFIASLRPVLEPMYQKLELLIERAKAQNFRLEMRRVDSSVNLSLHLYRIYEVSYRLMADSMVHLSPYQQGLWVWFLRASIEIRDTKSGIPHEETSNWKYSWSGWVPYSSISDTDLSNIIKWLALGESAAPHFHNAILEKPTSSKKKGWLARLFE